MAEHLLTIEEAADRLRKTPRTMHYWRSAGLGPQPARIGRRLLYRESDIDAFIEQQFAKETAS